MEKLLKDFRFIVGLFFLLMSVILFFSSQVNPTSDKIGVNLNLIVSIYLGVFSVIMMGTAFWSNQEP